MQHRTVFPSRVALVSVVLLVLLAVGSAAAWQNDADEPGRDDEPRTTLGKFLRAKRMLRGVIANTEGRIRNRVVGIDDLVEDPTKPAQVCCSRNIRKIEEYVFSMGPLMRTLQECYRAEGNVDGDLQVGFLRADVEGLFRVTREFRDAPAKEVDFRFSAITRAFHIMDRSAKKLTECPSSSDGDQ